MFSFNVNHESSQLYVVFLSFSEASLVPTLRHEILHLFFRLGIAYPELSQMQVRAIFEAATAMAHQGIKVLPEIMVPLVGTPQV
jgi:phosphoenolpyruvate synthase/pyruvate phosphate dikinase